MKSADNTCVTNPEICPFHIPRKQIKLNPNFTGMKRINEKQLTPKIDSNQMQ